MLFVVSSVERGDLGGDLDLGLVGSLSSFLGEVFGGGGAIFSQVSRSDFFRVFISSSNSSLLASSVLFLTGDVFVFCGKETCGDLFRGGDLGVRTFTSRVGDDGEVFGVVFSFNFSLSSSSSSSGSGEKCRGLLGEVKGGDLLGFVFLSSSGSTFFSNMRSGVGFLGQV